MPGSLVLLIGQQVILQHLNFHLLVSNNLLSQRLDSVFAAILEQGVRIFDGGLVVVNHELGEVKVRGAGEGTQIHGFHHLHHVHHLQAIKHWHGRGMGRVAGQKRVELRDFRLLLVNN